MKSEYTVEINWTVPVLIRIGHGSSEEVISPSSALEYMQTRWPSGRGDHYINAVSKCELAVAGIEQVEVAREAFIAAAIEGYVLA
jgi:hypothetical protein